jgi:hypothetical protein
MNAVMKQVAKEEAFVRTPMTAAEIACLNGNVEVFAAGTVEHARITRCIDGAPGEGGGIVPAMELSIRDAATDQLHTRTIPLARLRDIREGQAVRMYVTKRGWANHILTWHVLPAIH